MWTDMYCTICGQRAHASQFPIVLEWETIKDETFVRQEPKVVVHQGECDLSYRAGKGIKKRSTVRLHNIDAPPVVIKSNPVDKPYGKIDFTLLPPPVTRRRN